MLLACVLFCVHVCSYTCVLLCAVGWCCTNYHKLYRRPRVREQGGLRPSSVFVSDNLFLSGGMLAASSTTRAPASTSHVLAPKQHVTHQATPLLDVACSGRNNLTKKCRLAACLIAARITCACQAQCWAPIARLVWWCWLITHTPPFWLQLCV